jgi:hypothetical protein
MRAADADASYGSGASWPPRALSVGSALAADIELMHQDDNQIVDRRAALPEHVPVIQLYRRGTHTAEFWGPELSHAKPGIERIDFKAVESTVDRFNYGRHAGVCFQRIHHRVRFGPPGQLVCHLSKLPPSQKIKLPYCHTATPPWRVHCSYAIATL